MDFILSFILIYRHVIMGIGLALSRFLLLQKGNDEYNDLKKIGKFLFIIKYLFICFIFIVAINDLLMYIVLPDLYEKGIILLSGLLGHPITEYIIKNEMSIIRYLRKQIKKIIP